MWSKPYHGINFSGFPDHGFISRLFCKAEFTPIVLYVGAGTGDQSVKVDPRFLLQSWQEKGFAEQPGSNHTCGYGTFVIESRFCRMGQVQTAFEVGEDGAVMCPSRHRSLPHLDNAVPRVLNPAAAPGAAL